MRARGCVCVLLFRFLFSFSSVKSMTVVLRPHLSWEYFVYPSVGISVYNFNLGDNIFDKSMNSVYSSLVWQFI